MKTIWIILIFRPTHLWPMELISLSFVISCRSVAQMDCEFIFAYLRIFAYFAFLSLSFISLQKACPAKVFFLLLGSTITLLQFKCSYLLEFWYTRCVFVWVSFKEQNECFFFWLNHVCHQAMCKMLKNLQKMIDAQND